MYGEHSIYIKKTLSKLKYFPEKMYPSLWIYLHTLTTNMQNRPRMSWEPSLKELNLYFNIMNVKLCLLNQEMRKMKER